MLVDASISFQTFALAELYSCRATKFVSAACKTLDSDWLLYQQINEINSAPIHFRMASQQK